MTDQNKTFAEALHHVTENGNVYALVQTDKKALAWKKKEEILPSDKPEAGLLARLVYFTTQLTETRLESERINKRLERIEKILEEKQ